MSSSIPTRQQKRRVIVLGAGMAGLACARELRHRRYEVLVVEARARCGGRLKGMCMETTVNSNSEKDDATTTRPRQTGMEPAGTATATSSSQQQQQQQQHCVDVGGALIHGIDDNPLYDFVNKMGISTHPVSETCLLLNKSGRPIDRAQDERVSHLFNDHLERAFQQQHVNHQNDNTRSADESSEENDSQQPQHEHNNNDHNNDHNNDPALSFGALLNQIQSQQQSPPLSPSDSLLYHWHQHNLEVSCGASLKNLGHSWNDDEAYGFEGAHVALEPSWRAVVQTLREDLDILHECVVQSVHYENEKDKGKHSTARNRHRNASKTTRPNRQPPSPHKRPRTTPTPTTTLSLLSSPTRRSRRLQGEDALDENVRRSARTNKGRAATPFYSTDDYERTAATKSGKRNRTGNATNRPSIDSNSKVRIVVRIRNGPPRVLEADAVVCTLPLGILQIPQGDRGHVAFDPPLPVKKRTAIQSLGCGLLNKCVLSFDKVFWKHDAEFLGLAEDPPSLVLHTHVVTGKPMVVFLFGGDRAREIEDETDQDIVRQCLEVLRKACRGVNVPPPVDYVVTRWGKDAFARGAFVYIPPGVDGTRQLQAMSEPIVVREKNEKTTPVLLFAGEHTTPYHPSTIHGAYLSGIREAYRLDLTLEPALNHNLEFQLDHVYERTFPVRRRYSNRTAQPVAPSAAVRSLPPPRHRRGYGDMTLRKRRRRPTMNGLHQHQQQGQLPSRRSQRTAAQTNHKLLQPANMLPYGRQEQPQKKLSLMERTLMRAYEAHPDDWSLIHSKVFPVSDATTTNTTNDGRSRHLSVAQLRAAHRQLVRGQPVTQPPSSFQSWLASSQSIPRVMSANDQLENGVNDNRSAQNAGRKKSKRAVKSRVVMDL